MLRKLAERFLVVAICLTVTACAGLTWGDSESPSARAMHNQAMVRQTLDQLIAAYQGKNIRQFETLVSDRYVGDPSLGISVMRDFSTYHNLELRYTINNITFSDQGKVFVALTFTRSWTEIKTNKTASATKETSLLFVLEDGVYKLYQQSAPRLFGVN